MDYSERQKQSVTLPPELVHALWKEIKDARDDALNTAMSANARYERCDALLKRMKAIGMAAHLPTIEEIQAAWARDEE